MTHWWQWPDSIFSFPGSFCQDSSPTQLHALTYVLLVYIEAICILLPSYFFFIGPKYHSNIYFLILVLLLIFIVLSISLNQHPKFQEVNNLYREVFLTNK